MIFLEALNQKKQSGSIPVIPDIKCFSPKEGELMNGRDPLEYARALEAAGAPALSVVTEEKEFHGSMEMLKTICENVHIPVLRKDFIEEVRDLDETAKAGASAVLLITACLGEEKLTIFYREAMNRGLLPLVETHTEEEFDFALKLRAPFIGINNRNILKLEKDDGDVRLAADLLVKKSSLKYEPFLLVESALKDAEDVRTAIGCGADAALVGTALLQAEDPQKLYRAMTRKSGLKICGIMNEKDADLCLEAGADILGFVTEYPVPVPWDIPREKAGGLIARVKGRAKTCIVTGGTPEKVLQLAAELKPDYVQLHYRETLEESSYIAEELHKEGIRVIRSIPQDGAMRREMFGSEEAETILRLLSDSPIDVILLDSRDAGNAAVGGGGILPEMTESIRKAVAGSQKAVALGGGITDENVRQILQAIPADCIDVMTGVEECPGRKSAKKIQALISAM